MSFTIDGASETVYKCDECGWSQTARHFVSSGDNLACTMCGGQPSKQREIQPSVGMSDFKYRELLAALDESADGVGATTVENIETHFESGDDFLKAAEAAYQELEYEALEAVTGIGRASAKEIALTIAAEQGWENGAIFQF